MREVLPAYPTVPGWPPRPQARNALIFDKDGHERAVDARRLPRAPRRAPQGLPAPRGGAAVVPPLEGARLLPRRRARREPASVLHRAAAAQRDRLAAPRPRPHRHLARRAHPLEAHERLQRALAPRHRPRRHRHPDDRRARAPADGGQEPPRPRPCRVPQAGLGVEGALRLAHRRAARGARRLPRLGARTLHHGRGALARRPRGLRAPPRGGARLPRPEAHQLVPRLPHRPLRPRGGLPGGRREGRAVELRVSPGRAHRWAGGGRGRHHPPGDHAWRHRGGGAPRRRALPGGGGQGGGAPHHRASTSPSSPTPSWSTPPSAPAPSR